MYPKNAASPPEVDLGQILQLSDGAIQTSGASVRVKIGTGAWGAGAGALSCDSTSGIWTYAPTQAETNAAYFIIGVYKASCTALSKTVVTSISATAGYAGLDWANILSPTTTVNLSGTTTKAVTDRVTANTDQIAGASVSTSTAQIGVNVVNAGGTAWGSGAITAAAIASNAITSAKLATDCITSAQLASTAITEIQSGLATTANVAAVETDTQDIQSRLPAALVSGRMDASVGAMAANTLTASTLATDAVEEIADGVWDEPYAGHTTAGSFGKLMDLLRKANLTIDGTVSNAITPTTLTFSSNVSATTSAYAHAVLLFVSGPLAGENSPIVSYNNTNGVFVLEEPLTAAPSNGDEFVVIAGSHVHAIADIQSGLATSAQAVSIKGVTDKLDTTVELDGAVYRFTTNALEQAPSGGGGGTGTGARTVTITVDDGTNPLENARVRVTSGAETYVTSTDVSGVVTFNLDDATWVVSITKPGYTFAGASLVVDGTEAVTYSMSLVTITPSSVDKVTGYWTVLDETGSAAASVVVTIKARQPLRGGAGIIHDAGERTATSNGSGLIQFTNLIPGWRYAVVANDDYVADFVVPADAVTSVELGSIVARLP